MDYIRTEADGQLALTQSTEYLVLPSCLYGFHNNETTVETAKSGRFGKLSDNHFVGIIAHATFKISSGKIEGINQKIKTLRRHGYGYPDDEYFFLKIMDMSRKPYVRNQLSHKICD